ncbi:enolase C-terminal domain-like protein [Macrococcoides caseolyticum]|uniref:enolase C-terminal domain-like protein n=1 Tax=Macrococcoides caseolyticum TaxID=69966 RepID=UPI001F1C9B0E|nr:enolase C-terminal domain-like protein [Macrococcus caseolyticus]MCE4957970.1 hypothetical protein [Macrococcus caseolyticus]
MNISQLNLYHFEAPFNTPIQTNIITLKTRKVLVVGLVIDGIEYFAEANSFETPWYHYETISSVAREVVHVFHQIKAMPENMQSYLQTIGPNARSCYDIIMYQYQNDLSQVSVPIGQTMHHFDTQVRPDAARVKLKMHQDILKQVQAIRTNSDVPIVIDANGQLDERHFHLLYTLNQYDILYFEEPFSELKHYQALHQIYREIPLAIDESATSVEQIKQYHASGVHTAVIKYSRIGGIHQALQLKETLTDIRLVAGGMYEFGLSKYFTALLGQIFQTVPDVTPQGTYFISDYSHYHETNQHGLLTIDVPKVNRTALEQIASYQ